MSCEFRNIKIEALSICLPDTANGIASKEQTASDLAYQAAKEILDNNKVNKEEIAGLLFLSSTPDYRSPATAMLLQSRLKLTTDAIVFDVNSSGNSFNLGIQLGHSTLNSSNAKHVLVLYGETPSKQIKQEEVELSNRKDYGAAVLISKSDLEDSFTIQQYTNSNEWEAILLEAGGYKNAKQQSDDMPYSNLELLGPLEIKMDKVKAFQKEALDNFYVKHQIDDKNISLISNFQQDVLITNEDLKALVKSKKHNAEVDFFGLASQLQLQEIIDNSTAQKNKIVSLNYAEGLTASCMIFQIDNSIFTTTLKSNHFFEEGDVSHDI